MPGVTEAQDREMEKLRESLRLCQLELAAARDDQESWMEQRARLRRRRASAEKSARALSVALAEQFASRTAVPPIKRLVRAVRRRAGFDGSRLTQDEQLSIIRGSSLFRPAFYLRTNLDVVEAGWDPAVHYLEVGASEGRRPGPEFDTKGYVEAHPEVVEQGVNPLVHFLFNRHGRDITTEVDQ